MSLCKKIAYALSLLIAVSSTVVAQTCNKANIPATTPSSRFTVLNGTITDTTTGLVWKQCSEGLSGNLCTVGRAATYTWKAALLRAQAVNTNGGFAGYTDWRLPNVKELRSIVERQCNDPASNVTVFPYTVSNYYWTSSPVASVSSSAWLVGFSGGGGGWYGKGSAYYVRLVRSGQ